MSDIAAPMPGQVSPKPNLDTKIAPTTAIIFILLLATGLLFTVYGVYSDVLASGVPVTTYIPFLLLGAALLIALGFEFVNGFHDTANAVATVIYTIRCPRSLRWSGQAFSTSWACCFPAVRLLSALFRFCRSS